MVGEAPKKYASATIAESERLSLICRAAAPGEEAVVLEAGFAVGERVPAKGSTRPPAASRTAWPAAVSHSIVVPKRG